jgi:ubiquinone/menaquinone biosynthesis C-methylase UbiE
VTRRYLTATPAGEVSPGKAIEEERLVRDAQAADYHLNCLRLEWEFAAMDRSIQRLLELRSSDHVVDAGCGTGRHLPWLLDHAAHVTGIDHSPRSLEEARRGLDAQRAAHLELIEGDFRALPLGDRTADRLLCAVALQHLPTAEFRHQAAREFHRVLNPGGLTVIVVYKWLGHIGWRRDGFFEAREGRVPFHAFTSRELRTLLAGVGFTDIEIGGVAVFPRLFKRLPLSPEATVSLGFSPVFRHLGDYLIARAVRRRD